MFLMFHTVMHYDRSSRVRLFAIFLLEAQKNSCIICRRLSERSSVVERHLAKVRVEGSNPFARSIFLPANKGENAFRPMLTVLSTRKCKIAENGAFSHMVVGQIAKGPAATLGVTLVMSSHRQRLSQRFS